MIIRDDYLRCPHCGNHLFEEKVFVTFHNTLLKRTTKEEKLKDYEKEYHYFCSNCKKEFTHLK